MVNLPLKMIHFQSTNNWEGYIKAIRKLYHIVFLVIAITTLEIYHIIASK